MKKKILLIEDDDIVRENTAEILELAHYIVETAKNGRIGIEKTKSFLPDVILCDILMPEIDGYGVLQIISREPNIAKIPFIFITAKTEHSDVRKGMNLGADDYILKPFQESELISAIESRLKRREVFENNDKPIVEDYHKSIDEFLTSDNLISLKKDNTIYCEGNNSKYLYLIGKGKVKTYKITTDGKELITGMYNEGDYFGYTSFFIKLPHSEYAVCLTNCSIYKILKEDIIDLVEKNHLFAFEFIERLSKNVKEVKEQLIRMAYGSVRKKTAAILLNLAKKSDLENEIKVSRSDLASLTGVAKETLIRTLTDFKDEGIITTSRNMVKIIDIKELKKII